jgi:hypothetical protein
MRLPTEFSVGVTLVVNRPNESKMLRRKFGPKREEMENGKNCIIRSSFI